MKFKLKPDFTDRIPLNIHRKGNTVFFQLQHEIVGFARHSGGLFCEYDKITTDNISEIGLMAQRLLNRFHEISDLTSDRLGEIMSEKNNEFLNENTIEWLSFMEAKDYNKIESTYENCSIGYNIPNDKYTFTLWWYKKEVPVTVHILQENPAYLHLTRPLNLQIIPTLKCSEK